MQSKLILAIVGLFLLSNFALANQYDYNIDVNSVLADSGVDADLDIDVNVDTSDLKINEDGSVSGEIKTDIKTTGMVNGQNVNQNQRGNYNINANRNGSVNATATVRLEDGRTITRTITREGNKTEVNLYVDGELVREGYVYRSNNSRNVTVRVMPTEASEKAIERLRLNGCSEENNCTIELKQVGEGNNSKVVYEINVQEQKRFLGLFKRNIFVSAEVDAETGEIIKTRKPWFYF